MIHILLLLCFLGEPVEDKFELFPYQEKLKFDRIELAVWVSALTFDVMTTYDAIHENGAKEMNPLYSNFNKDTKFGEMWLQAAVIDMSFQLFSWKLTKRTTIRLSIGAHYFAGAWNISQNRKKQ